MRAEECSDIWAGSDVEATLSPKAKRGGLPPRLPMFPAAEAPTMEVNVQCSRTGSLESLGRPVGLSCEVEPAPLDLKAAWRQNEFYRAEAEAYRSEIRKLEAAISENSAHSRKLEEFVFFLQGKYRDKNSLDALRGARLGDVEHELEGLRGEIEEKDDVILALLNEKNELEQKLRAIQETAEEETRTLREALDADKVVKKASRNRVEDSDVRRADAENRAREAEALAAKLQKEIDRLQRNAASLTDREAKLQAENSALRARADAFELAGATRSSGTDIDARLDEQLRETRAQFERERESDLCELALLREKIAALVERPHESTAFLIDKAVQFEEVSRGVETEERALQVDTISSGLRSAMTDLLDFASL